MIKYLNKKIIDVIDPIYAKISPKPIYYIFLTIFNELIDNILMKYSDDCSYLFRD